MCFPIAKWMQPRLFQNMHRKHSPERTEKDYFYKLKKVTELTKHPHHSHGSARCSRIMKLHHCLQYFNNLPFCLSFCFSWTLGPKWSMGKDQRLSDLMHHVPRHPGRKPIWRIATWSEFICNFSLYLEYINISSFPTDGSCKKEIP